ncbi:MAG: S8 family serine peptidase [Bifidobacteriaceae bacterium]|nr:S8 family serine peptidase [Bifidobacteriaceae bacterium]
MATPQPDADGTVRIALLPAEGTSAADVVADVANVEGNLTSEAAVEVVKLPSQPGGTAVISADAAQAAQVKQQLEASGLYEAVDYDQPIRLRLDEVSAWDEPAASGPTAEPATPDTPETPVEPDSQPAVADPVAGGVTYSALPNDPYYVYQAALKDVPGGARFDQVWPRLSDLTASQGPETAKIAVLDYGFYPDLADFTGAGGSSVTAARNAAYLADGTIQPCATGDSSESHGTAVVSVIAAVTNNGLGVAGAAYDGQVVGEKIQRLGSCGAIYPSDIYDSVVDAIDNHQVRVILMSFSYPEPVTYLRRAVDYAAAHGVLVVCSGGNDPTEGYTYPSAYSSTLSVGATDQTGELAAFSNRSGQVDITAPGVAIPSWVTDGPVVASTGTSFAAPLVAAAASLLFRFNPAANASQVRAALEGTARGSAKLLDVAAAVDVISGLTVGQASVASVELPAVSGVGDVVVPVVSDPQPATATLSYEWHVGLAAAPVGYGPTYTVTAADLGRPLWVVVTASAVAYEDSVPKASPAVALPAAVVGLAGQVELSDGGPATGFTADYEHVVCATGETYALPAVVGEAGGGAPGEVSDAGQLALPAEGSFAVGRFADECYRLRLLSPLGEWVSFELDGVVAESHVVPAAATGLAIRLERPAVLLLEPTIQGQAAEGQTLRARVTVLPADATLTYTWLRDGVPVPGSDQDIYQVRAVDAGHVLTVRVTAASPGCTPATATAVGVTVAGEAAGVSGRIVAQDGGSVAGWKIWYAHYFCATRTQVVEAVNDWGYVTVLADGAFEVGVSPYECYRLFIGSADGHYVSSAVGGVTGLEQSLPAGSREVEVLVPTQVTVDWVAVTGEAAEGVTLYAVAGGVAPANAAVAFAWYRDGIAIAGAEGDNYTVTAADAGHDLTVAVTASFQDWAPAVATSYALAVPGGEPPVLTGVVVSGQALAGATLTASVSYSPSDATLTYLWFRDTSLIGGATGSTYKLTAADLGHDIVCKVTASHARLTTAAKYSNHVFPAGLAEVKLGRMAGSPAAGGEPLEAKVGEPLEATVAYWALDGALTYLWFRGTARIVGADGPVYTPTPADAGQDLVVKVTLTRPGVDPVVKYSNHVVVGA